MRLKWGESIIDSKFFHTTYVHTYTSHLPNLSDSCIKKFCPATEWRVYDYGKGIGRLGHELLKDFWSVGRVKEVIEHIVALVLFSCVELILEIR